MSATSMERSHLRVVGRTERVEAGAEAVRRRWMTLRQAALALDVDTSEIRIALDREARS